MEEAAVVVVMEEAAFDAVTKPRRQRPSPGLIGPEYKRPSDKWFQSDATGKLSVRSVMVALTRQGKLSCITGMFLRRRDKAGKF